MLPKRRCDNLKERGEVEIEMKVQIMTGWKRMIALKRETKVKKEIKLMKETKLNKVGASRQMSIISRSKVWLYEMI